MDFLEEVKKSINQRKTLLHSLGIELLEVSKNEVRAKMPVDERTHQMYGMLHGGASVALAETLCSIGAHLFIEIDTQMAVGLEINANHIKSMRSGWVIGVAKPIHIGKKTQIWQMELKNEEDGSLVCTSRCTMAVIDKK